VIVAITRFSSLTDTSASEQLEVSCTDWLTHLSREPRAAYAGDMQQGGWSPAVFDPPARLRANIRAVGALVLDYDKGADWDQLVSTWGLCYGLIYTTKRHTDATPRLRVVLPLARGVSADEYDRLWQWGKRISPCVVDEQAKDASRFWYDPSPPTGAWRSLELTGAIVSPDAVLSLPEPPKLRVVRPAVPQSDDDRAKRAAAYLAKIPGATAGDGGHTTTFNAVAHVMIGFDLSEADTEALIANEYNPRCDPPWSERELAHKIKSVAASCKRTRGYLLTDRVRVSTTRAAAANAPEVAPEVEVDWYAMLAVKKDGSPRRGYNNVRIYVRHHPSYRGRWSIDLMTSSPWFDGAVMPEIMVHDIRASFDQSMGFTPSREDVEAAVVAAAHERPFHPVTQYLRSIDWDGTPRLASMARDYLGSESAYEADVIRKFMVGAVARALHPGHKVDTCLVLAGPEGHRKSSFFATLGGAWHADSFLDLTSRDGLLQLHSSWIYEFAEIENVLGGRAASRTKSWLTSAHDLFRAPYARVTEKRARGAVVCGTTNRERILTEDTGSRRFWIVPVCRRIDHELLAQCRDHLWAEAVCAYEAGERWWLDDASELEREVANEAHTDDDSWAELVGDYLANPGLIQTTVSDVLIEALKVEISRHDRWSQTRVARILGDLGMRRVREPGAGRRWVYRRSS